MLDMFFENNDEEELNNKIQLKALYPKTFNEASDISEFLKNNVGTVINISNLQAEDRQRLLDFISGVCLALNGRIVRVDDNVIIATPRIFDLENVNHIKKEEL